MTSVSTPLRASAKWLYAFVLLQFVCQMALIAPLGSSRVAFRATAFTSSLVMLVLVPAGGRPYPARPLVAALIVITALGLFHPDLNTMSAGLAQVALSTAVWAPLLWTTRIGLDMGGLRTLILLLWGFNTLSSIVGVLQVYDPNRFAPDPRFVQELYGTYADALKIKIASGETVWRPMGLTDSPGGATVSGQFAFLTGRDPDASNASLLAWKSALENGVRFFHEPFIPF